MALMSFAEIEARLPIRGKALRRLLGRLGFRRAPGIGQLYFSEDDLAVIESAIRVRRDQPTAAAAEPRAMMTRTEKTRATRAMMAGLRPPRPSTNGS